MSKYFTTHNLLKLMVFITISGCYTLRQGYEGAKLLSSRQHVDDVIADRKDDDKVRIQLNKVKEILHYANVQGLNVEGAYEHLIEIDRQAVSYLVQAAKKDQLVFKTWWFPFVGEVPYKGFFDKEERNREAQELREEDYDVYEGAASAFSSLGWFEDPIFSPMLNYSDAELADLFFHELIHRTFWVTGEAEFNENLAEYLAQNITVKYLNEKKLNKELERYLQGKDDKKKYIHWLKSLKSELEQFYLSKKDKSKQEVLEEKAKIFNTYTTLKRPQFKVLDYIGKKEWNNATVLAASLYSPDIELFERSYRCSMAKNAGEYLDKLKKTISDEIKSFQALEKMCESV